MKIYLLITLTLLSNNSIADIKDKIINIESINDICKINRSSYTYKKSGFPIIETKHKVVIKDKRCNINATISVYDFVSDGFASNKYSDFINASRDSRIIIKPTDESKNTYKYEGTAGKYLIISKKSNYVYHAVFNVEPKLGDKFINLIESNLKQL